MCASASSDMFSINITKQHNNTQNKEAGRLQIKVVRQGAEIWGMATRKEDRLHSVQEQGLTDLSAC